MTAPLRIGLAGLGTVGAGVVRLLAANADILSLRCARPLVVTAVAARDRFKDRGLDLGAARWVADAADLADAVDVDVVVELIGGSEGVARSLVERALDRGKPVITANKALLAEHGLDLARRAEATGVALAFEAAVAGGIPIVKLLRDGLAGNRVDRVLGILNGTSNFILSEMAGSGRSFDSVLAQAQAEGYAEADPSFDVDGIDAAHKLVLLASLAFGMPPRFAGAHVEGIRHVTAADIRFAAQLGYGIKLLAIAERTLAGARVRVHPCLVPADGAVARVGGVLNAVALDGDFVGTLVIEGRGAGERPTASAVVADLVDLGNGLSRPVFGLPADRLAPLDLLPIADRVGSCYLRLDVVDRPGVIAEIAAVLRDEEISIESLLQRGRAPGEGVPIVIVTHEVREAAIARALERFTEIRSVLEPPVMIRIEPLQS